MIKISSRNDVSAALVLASWLACAPPPPPAHWSITGVATASARAGDVLAAAHDDLDALRRGGRLADEMPAPIRGAYRGLFGGLTYDAAARYVDGRIQHLLHVSELDNVWPCGLWALSELRGHLTPVPRERALEDGEPKGGTPARVPAVNLGAMLWLTHRAIGITPLISTRGEVLTLDSPRAGVVAITDDYLAGTDGRAEQLHLQVQRQATLIHEARHSDCTGGVPASLGPHQNVDSAAFPSDFSGRCGHLHARCPDGDLAGLLACDIYPWGAYAAQLVFLDAARRSGTPVGGTPWSSSERRYLDSLVIDYRSRLLFDAAAMMRGELGPADAGHSVGTVVAPERPPPRAAAVGARPARAH